MRGRYLRQKYKVDPQYEYQKLNEQFGVCAICGKGETRTRGFEQRALSLDHNHDTTAPRGSFAETATRELAISAMMLA